MSSWRDLTEADIRRLTASRTSRRLPGATPSKYKAVKTTVDGIVFDSKKEAQHWHTLKMRERAGEVTDIKRQVKHELTVADIVIGHYIADFEYYEWDRQYKCWRTVVVVDDVKGFKTPLYRWKKKHFEAQYGIQIRET